MQVSNYLGCFFFTDKFIAVHLP